MIADEHRPTLPSLGDRRAAEDPLQQAIYAVTHDLQAPARHIRAFVELLVEHLGGLDPVAEGYADHLLNAAETLRLKLDALTRFSRAVSGHTARERFDSREAATAAGDSLAAEFAALGAHLLIEELLPVRANRDQLVAVFTELLANSVRFGSPGMVVRVTATPGERFHTVAVSDDGPGFVAARPVEAFRLFRRFHRSDVPGTGVGLAIVEQVVLRHGGVVSIDSRTATGDPSGACGTRVELTLPAAAADPRADDDRS